MPEQHEERVSVEIKDGVADVRLNRPDKLNALDLPMFEALVEAGERLAADPSVRAVVLSGEGRGFCAGLDFTSFQAMADGGTGAGETGAEASGSGQEASGSGQENRSGGGLGRLGRRIEGRITNLGQQAAYVWTDMPVPVIAAVHGVALGGGFQIALAADIRIAAPDAKFSVLEIRWGLIPDMTGTHMLRRLVPLDVAKELTWTGRMVSGEEAVSLGIATKVSADPLGDALEMARTIADSNPDAIRGAKELLNQSGQVPAAQQFLDESRIMASLIGSPNQVEAVMAYFEKRPALFDDPVL